jgi:hypothetical protein
MVRRPPSPVKESQGLEL